MASQTTDGPAKKKRGLAEADVPEDYLTALELFWRAGCSVQRSYTTELLKRADGLGINRLQNMPPNWKASKMVGAKGEAQHDFVHQLCIDAGYGYVPSAEIAPLLHAAALPADQCTDGWSMIPLQAAGAQGHVVASQSAAAAAGMSLTASQQQQEPSLEVHAYPQPNTAAPQGSLTTAAPPLAGTANTPQQRKATQDRWVRLLEALMTEAVLKHVDQIQTGLRGPNADTNTLSSQYLMQLSAPDGPLMKYMIDLEFQPTNRFHYDATLGINNLDPSHAVLPGGDLRKWLGDLKIMTTRAFQTYRDQTGAPGCDPSEATVGANPVLLYAVRLMITNPNICPALNGAMPSGVQSEPDGTGMITILQSGPPAAPSSLSAVPPHMAQPPPAPASPKPQPAPRSGPLQLPNELVLAAKQQHAASWYQAQAAQGAIFAHKCEGLKHIAETVRAVEGITRDTDMVGKLNAMLKRGVGWVESDPFFRDQQQKSETESESHVGD